MTDLSPAKRVALVSSPPPPIRLKKEYRNAYDIGERDALFTRIYSFALCGCKCMLAVDLHTSLFSSPWRKYVLLVGLKVKQGLTHFPFSVIHAATS